MAIIIQIDCWGNDTKIRAMRSCNEKNIKTNQRKRILSLGGHDHWLTRILLFDAVDASVTIVTLSFWKTSGSTWQILEMSCEKAVNS